MGAARRASTMPLHHSPARSLLPHFLALLYTLALVYASLQPFAPWIEPLPETPFFLFAPWPPRWTRFDAIANTVPEAIKESGKLVVGVNIPYAPNEFKDPSGKIVGFDVDLMNAIAGTLGLTTEYRESDFAKIIPSIQGGTYNVGMSSFTDTKEREESVDFVTYFSAGIQGAQRPGSPVDPNNACGKKVAVQATTTEETEELPAKSKACVDAGKPPIDMLMTSTLACLAA